MTSLLLVDANYVCSRAYFATGQLTHNGKGTGMALGAIQTVEICEELFGTDLTVLAFDTGKNKRREIYPEYKANRRENLTEEERAVKIEYLKQIKRMPKVFHRMGYRNILHQWGYEADDVIASVVLSLEENDRAVIVSADQDLWQLLQKNVICYDPRAKRKTSRKTFMDEWGVAPEMWPHVKALAGDASDNVKGLRGIGLKTAAKYFARGRIGDAAKKKIEDGIEIHNRNLVLVRLPYPGTEDFELVENEVTDERREYVFSRLGASVKRWRK